MTTRMPEPFSEGKEYYRAALAANKRQKAAEAAQVRRNRIAARKPEEKPTPRQAEHPLGTPLQKGALRATPVRAHTFNLDRGANPPVKLTNELKEMGLDIVPVYGTYRSARALAAEWQHLSMAQKISGVALTGMSAAGDVFIVVGAVKGGVAVLKVSAKAARGSPGIVRRILTEETGAIKLGRAEGVKVVSASGRSSGGGVSRGLQDELAEVLRGKGFGKSAAPKVRPPTGRAVIATKKIYVGPPGASSFNIPAPLRQALGIPSGRYMATGASAQIAESIITAYPKADPELKARIIEHTAENVRTGTIVLVDNNATGVSTRTLGQEKTESGTKITVIEQERVNESLPPASAPAKEKVPSPKPTRTGRAQPGRPRQPGPGRPTPPSGGPPALFRFKGRSLPAGQYPRVVSYRQGFIRWHLDLDTGERTPRRAAGRPGADPWRTFRIETTDRTPPKAQLIDLGLFDVSVTERGIGRFRKQGELRDRSTQQRRGRP